MHRHGSLLKIMGEKGDRLLRGRIDSLMLPCTRMDHKGKVSLLCMLRSKLTRHRLWLSAVSAKKDCAEFICKNNRIA